MLTHDEMLGLQAEKHDLIDASRFRSEQEYVIHLMHTAAYAQASAIAAGKRVLDLGCNTGYGTRILSGSAAEAVGVDVSPSAIAEACKLYGDSRARFEMIDGRRLPFPDGHFDVISCFQVLEHVVDHSAFVRELKRVLAPEGVVLFTTPNAAIRLDPGMTPWNEFHVREFEPEGLRAALSSLFAHVSLHGLFADEPLYSMERRRVDGARRRARERQRALPAVRPGPADVLAHAAASALGWARARLPDRSERRVRSFAARHGIERFHYRDDRLADALDLLAICGDREQSVRGARGLLSIRTV